MKNNQVILLGNIVRPPETLSTSNGNQLSRFRFACNRKTSGKDGERQADFFDVEVWGRQAEHLYSSCAVGDRLIIIGKLRQQEWLDKEGGRHSRLIVSADAVGLSLEFNSYSTRTREDISISE